MDPAEMNALLHELRCRDEYGLKSSGQMLALRALWDDLPGEVDVLRTMWGDLCPPEPVGVLVMAVGDSMLAVPLGQAEFAKWDAAAATIERMDELSPEAGD